MDDLDFAIARALAEMEAGAPIQEESRGRDKEQSRDTEIRRDRSRFIVFREPFADQRSPERGADRHRNRIEPRAMHRALGQLMQVRPIGFANLAPSDRHRAEERTDEAAEENRWRDWNWHSRDDERHQSREKGLEVDDRRDDDRMRMAQAELEQQQPGHSDEE